MRFLLALISSFYLAYCTLSGVLMFAVNALVYLLAWPFDRTSRIINYITTVWTYHFVWINPTWKARYEGREFIDPNRPYVMVSNHQSAADIFVLYGLLRPFKWVSKEAIFKIPLIGWNMILNRYVSLKRGDMSSTREMFEVCQKHIGQGDSVMMFPEGTRSRNGEILKFKRGPFRLACEVNVPVIPIVVDGTGKILPKGARRVHFSPQVHVRVLPPVYPQDYNNDSYRLCDDVFDMMSQELQTMRAESLAPEGRRKVPELARTQ